MLKRKKGSALVYTLIMMMLLLVGALGLATTTLIQQRRVAGTAESVRAFQLANDGFAHIVAQYKNADEGTKTKIEDLFGVSSCSGGEVTGNTELGSYTATFTDANLSQLTCGDPIAKAIQVKVVARVGSATRAIETAFGAAGAYQLTCVPVPWENYTPTTFHTVSCCRFSTASGSSQCRFLLPKASGPDYPDDPNSSDFTWTDLPSQPSFPSF